MKTMKRAATALALAVLAASAACTKNNSNTGDSSTSTPTPTPAGLQKINHVVVIYLENHSFDNLYGEFDGAEGLSFATTTQTTQLDTNGVAYVTLPQPMDTSTHLPDPDFPANLPNAPFNIDAYKAPNLFVPDLVHRFAQEQMQINAGAMNKFAAWSDAKGLSMGYYHTSDLPLAMEAKRYTLCDHFFHAAFGGSFLNHIWLVAAASPTFPGGHT
ncbi:MAG TPA: alkaline phosphatase family protein, partial [bacterium]|nr:alkaline phosphatase family protein [bacterium]